MKLRVGLRGRLRLRGRLGLRGRLRLRVQARLAVMRSEPLGRGRLALLRGDAVPVLVQAALVAAHRRRGGVGAHGELRGNLA